LLEFEPADIRWLGTKIPLCAFQRGWIILSSDGLDSQNPFVISITTNFRTCR